MKEIHIGFLAKANKISRSSSSSCLSVCRMPDERNNIIPVQISRQIYIKIYISKSKMNESVFHTLSSTIAFLLCVYVCVCFIY